jgi:DNA-binding transcriptional LysR family regulator
METKTLRWFLEVARVGSLSGAALSIGVTQPALSHRLSALEDELGVQLFVRDGRGISLTSEGRYFRQRAKEIVELHDRTVAETRLMRQDEVKGDVRIGAGSCYTAEVLALAAADLSRVHPGVRYHIYDGNGEDFQERLDDGVLDFCIIYQPADIRRFAHMHVPYRERWGIIARPGSSLASLDRIRREDLGDEPLIVSRQTLEGDRFARSPLADWFGGDLGDLNIVGTYNLTFVSTLFAAQDIASVVSFAGQIRANESDVLHFKPLEPPVFNECDIVWRMNRKMTPAAEAYLESLRKVIESSGNDAAEAVFDTV